MSAHAHLPYVAALSSDGGTTWSKSMMKPSTNDGRQLGCARPRLLGFGKGAPIVLSGGRNLLSVTMHEPEHRNIWFPYCSTSLSVLLYGVTGASSFRWLWSICSRAAHVGQHQGRRGRFHSDLDFVRSQCADGEQHHAFQREGQQHSGRVDKLHGSDVDRRAVWSPDL